MDIDDYPEIEVIEVPVVKRMVFQFKKPVKMEFATKITDKQQANGTNNAL